MEEENIEKDMTPILLEDLGLRYPTENSKQRYRYGLYQCQYCGKEFEATTSNIKRGNTKSCGCYQKQKTREATTLHGLSNETLYKTWSMMKSRCYNIKHIYYKDYGGRGIQVCDRWLDINNFIEDMYPSWEEGLSLDRVDVDGDYEVGNCRWATQSIQSQNTREMYRHNTSGFRGVSWHKASNKWVASIIVNNKKIYLGIYHTAVEAAKAYERYVRLNNLEHNFTPALTEEEIAELELNKL